MKIEKTAAIAEIVSSIAIVATLAYLAIQSQQTNNMLVGNSRQAALQADLQLLSNMLNNPDAAARVLGFETERVENEVLLIHFMRTREYQWLQNEAGTLDLDTLESYMAPVDFWLLSDIGAEWWDTTQDEFDPEFAGFVNSFLERSSP
jgi:hypothetical protein